MSFESIISNKILIKAFYQRQSGFFLFVFLIFFGIVQPSTQLYFHFTLIKAMLEIPAFMALVVLAWLFYGLRVRRFVLEVLTDPDALFLYKWNALPPGRILWHCLWVQAGLYLPVIGYMIVVVGVAMHQKAIPQALGILGFVSLLVGAAAWEMRRRLQYPGVSAAAAGGRFGRSRRGVPYWSILLRFLLLENKGVLAGTKIFGCSILYLLLRLQIPGDYDLRMPFLAYCIAIFGHGVLLYRCRQLEWTQLYCYKALPVSRGVRFCLHALLCFLLLLPEMAVLGWLTPHPVRPADSLAFVVLGYALLLLLNSILAAWTLTVADYLKLCLVLFGILYCFVLKAWG